MADLHNDVIMQVAIVSGLGTSIHGIVVQEMDGNIVIGHSIYGVVVIDGLLYSRFYSSKACPEFFLVLVHIFSC